MTEQWWNGFYVGMPVGAVGFLIGLLLLLWAHDQRPKPMTEYALDQNGRLIQYVVTDHYGYYFEYLQQKPFWTRAKSCAKRFPNHKEAEDFIECYDLEHVQIEKA